MKKVLITILVAALSLGFGATAFAAASEVGVAFTDIAGHDAEFELTVLGALGIYSGPSGLGGTVAPDDPITRAEFCKVLVTAAGRSSTATGLAGLQPTFTDGASIPSWAWGYVNVAVYMGIINGYADGSFGANNPVTYAEAVTMLIRAVSGHVAQVPAGVWPYNYLFYGVDEGFTGPVDVGFANLPATRGDVARMLYATMQVNKLDKDGKELADDPDTEGTDEGTSLLKGRIHEGLLTSVSLDTNTCTPFGSLGDKVYVAGAENLNELLQVEVIAVADAAGDIVAFGKNENVTAISGVFEDWDNEDGVDYIVLTNGTEVPFVLYDGEATGYPEWNLNTDSQLPEDFQDEALGLAAGDELVITVNEAGKAALVNATRFEARDYIADEGVTESDVLDDGTKVDTHVDAAMADLDFDVLPTCLVTVNGSAADRDTLESYDVFDVALNNAGAAVVLRAAREQVEGTVEGTTTTYTSGSTVEKVTIDGKSYAINSDGDVTLPLKDDKVKYGLDADGKLFATIGYKGTTPFVMFLGYTEYGDGTASATVDVRGTETTYKVDADDTLRGDIQAAVTNGDFAWIDIDSSDNTIVGIETIAFDAGWYVVASSGGALTLGDDPDSPLSYEFIAADSGVTIYIADEDGNYTYLDPADLVADDDYLLSPCAAGVNFGAEEFWLYEPAAPVAP